MKREMKRRSDRQIERNKEGQVERGKWAGVEYSAILKYGKNIIKKLRLCVSLCMSVYTSVLSLHVRECVCGIKF